ncbi:response regulator [Fibrisoma montanum]|uniref:Response regulator n=1 Tax=Fibrisoma montanum TaxID=2305895 RepID=A0A418MHF2_9BACT|nr:response regulator [Fibrisoma montanum]RIV26771.1 response regulator [Fibrisoma montanum]
MPSRNCPLIYVVEDDADDAYVLSAMFNDYYKEYKVCFMENGSDLMLRLTHLLDGRLPNLILLDLNLPILNGKETLQLLACDDQFQTIPVAVLSGADQEPVMHQCFALGAAAFVSKIKSYPQLVQAIGDLMSQCLFSATESPL